MTAADYDNFRIIVSTVQVQEPTNHQGICFWGDRRPRETGLWRMHGCDAADALDVGLHDQGRTGGTDVAQQRSRQGAWIKRSQWTQAEILVNREKGPFAWR